MSCRIAPRHVTPASGPHRRPGSRACTLLVAVVAVFLWAPSPVAAHPGDHLATFDSFAEGPYGTELTDGGITFFGLDIRLPGLPPPSPWVIEQADATLGGMPGFTPRNALACCGFAPGPSAGFGRIGELRFTTGQTETDVSLELYALAPPGTVVTLEAIRNGVVVATDSVTLSRNVPPVEHHQLAIAGVAFDQLRLSGSNNPDRGVFFALIDTVRISNLGVRPAVCVAPPGPGPGAIVATPGTPTVGTPGDDVIYGSVGNDRISGLGGNDTIFGLAGNDQISGGDGHDTICGGDGDDLLSGGNGDDVISGDAGADDLSGGPGDDRLFGGAGTDRLAGGDGSDACAPGGHPGDAAAPPPSCDTIT